MGRRVKNPPYVQEFTDRFGKPRWYFRRPGFKRVPLPGLPWSPEFMAAHEAAMRGSPERIHIPSGQPGTVNAAIIAYYQSALWNPGLSAGTRAMRRAILDRFREAHGDKRIALLTPRAVRKIIEERPSHDAQKNFLKSLRGLIGFCLRDDLMSSDPTAGLKLARPLQRSSGHMTWCEEQIEQYRAKHPLGTRARVAIELLLNVAARRQDACLLGRQHLRNGCLTWRPSKTRRSTGKLLTIRVTPALQAALDAMPSSDSLTFLTTDYGKPFASAAAFGNKFADWCREAGLEVVECDDGRKRSFRAHGLRKAACRQLAHAGCTALEIQAVSGHATLAQLQVYVNEVEQERLAEAAMRKRQETETATDSVKLAGPV